MGRNGKYDATLNCLVNIFAQTSTHSSFPRRRESRQAFPLLWLFRMGMLLLSSPVNLSWLPMLYWIPAYAGMTNKLSVGA